ncbi:hypothetical protein U1Q18_029599, partial [Sarracenia purpurea var. burkii]
MEVAPSSLAGYGLFPAKSVLLSNPSSTAASAKAVANVLLRLQWIWNVYSWNAYSWNFSVDSGCSGFGMFVALINVLGCSHLLLMVYIGLTPFASHSSSSIYMCLQLNGLSPFNC